MSKQSNDEAYQRRQTERAAHVEWVRVIQEQGTGLSKWEQDFVESVGDQLTSGRYLSEKQADILERIYADKTP